MVPQRSSGVFGLPGFPTPSLQKISRLTAFKSTPKPTPKSQPKPSVSVLSDYIYIYIWILVIDIPHVFFGQTRGGLGLPQRLGRLDPSGRAHQLRRPAEGLLKWG